MTKRDKIVYGSLITVAIITTVIIFIRKKRPKLKFNYINWEGKYADITFGEGKARISPFSGGVMSAGNNYKKGYTLSYVPFDKDKVRLITKLNNKDLSEEIIEFESRLKYKN